MTARQENSSKKKQNKAHKNTLIDISLLDYIMDSWLLVFTQVFGYFPIVILYIIFKLQKSPISFITYSHMSSGWSQNKFQKFSFFVLEINVIHLLIYSLFILTND